MDLGNVSFSKNIPVIYIFGSTASGKTRLSIDIWKYLKNTGFEAEIVNCDSMQLYKGFDIGTAKVSREIRRVVPHHLMDILDINEECTASKYVKLATSTIEHLLTQNKIPIVVGGTHMYLKALIWKSIIDSSPDLSLNPSVRDEKYSDFTCEELYRQLLQIDPERASSLNVNDRRRIITSIEIFRKSGMNFTETTKKYPYELRYDNSLLFWIRNAKIRDYIDIRIEEMIKDGLLYEVFSLRKEIINCDKYTGILQGIAFKEFRDILNKRSQVSEISQEELNESINNLRRKTLQYSKRQEKYIKKHLITDRVKVNILLFNGEKDEVNSFSPEKSDVKIPVLLSENKIKSFSTHTSNNENRKYFKETEAESWQNSILNRAFDVINKCLFLSRRNASR